MPDLPAIGLGTYDMDAETCREAVQYGLEYGYRHVDTAEMYENEAAVGKALGAAAVDREDVFVATKLHSRHLSYDDAIEHAQQCRDRLGVETIDLLYVHWPIRSYDPEATLPAMDELRDRGVIRHVGLSNFTPSLLTEALDTLESPLFAHQVECHPFLPQQELRQLARDRGHHLVAYSPLAKGAVIDDPTITAIATENDVTPAQVSLAWLLEKDAVVPIPKSGTPAHIKANIAATELTLSQNAIDRIDAIEQRERVVDFDGAPWNIEDSQS